MEHLKLEQKYQEESYSFPYHYLDLRAEEYRLILHIEYLSRLRTVKDLLRPFHGQVILDAGCGDGRFCYEMRAENVHMVGVDFSESALVFARAFNPTVEFHAQDLKRLPFTSRFDAVVLIETLEHFVPEDVPAVLENIARVLRPGGKFVVTVPSVNIPLIKKHFQHFSEESLRATLSAHFRVVNCFGHSKTRGGVRTRLYWGIRRVSTWLYPLRNNIRPILSLLTALNDKYEMHYAVGKPEDCSGLIAVCEKLGGQAL